MTNFEFLQKYIRLQNGIMFYEVVDLRFASVGYSLTDKSGYWNNALTNQVLYETELSEIEKLLTSKDRNPSVYFEGITKNGQLIDFPDLLPQTRNSGQNFLSVGGS